MKSSAFDTAKEIARKTLPDPAWSLLRLCWAKLSFTAFRPRVVRHRYGPHELSMELIAFDGAHWYERDFDQPPEIALLAQCRLKPGA